MMRNVIFVFIALLSLAALPLAAQPQPNGQREVDVRFDTGSVQNEQETRGVIFAEVISVPDIPWIRLRFDHAVLGAAPEGGQATILRMTSLHDGAVQFMNATHLRQWGYSSAYFNGSEVLVEIIADPGAAASRLTTASVYAGPIAGSPDTRSICFTTDDRQLSNDPRSARVEPIGCSGWLINDDKKCFLTAGHCDGGMEVVEFNVPLSDASGNRVHPPPEDQYAIDPISIQSNGGQGVGNDWAYFGAFPNSNTGLTPYEAQGNVAYVLADPPDPAGQNIRITGYGSTSAPVSPTWNSVQKTHVGPFNFVNGTTLNYQTDTTGGNSGSPVIHEESGTAIGIHTHAGCNAGGGGNNGTNILHPDLQTALANPQGVCRPDPPLVFTFPEGIPEFLDPTGATLRVEVAGQNGGMPQPGTGRMTYDIGGGPVTVAMTEVSPNVYDAVFPSFDCGAVVQFEFSAETTLGDPVIVPESAPDRRFRAEAATGLDATFADNFETDQGWTVENDPSLTDGAWERAVPAGGGLRGDPRWDADGSGACFLTDNAPGNSDVDGGSTRLISPAMDATQGEAFVCYWLWYDTDDGTQDDTMTVEISDDDGANWTTLETIGPTGPGTQGGWILKTWRVADFVTPTNQVRLRFDVSDTGTGSIVEAGVDGVRMKRSAEGYICDEAPCVLDLNGDGLIDLTDMRIAASHWTTLNPLGDVNGDGQSDIRDTLQIISSYGDCPGPTP